jgi:hypothetical protein
VLGGESFRKFDFDEASELDGGYGSLCRRPDRKPLERSSMNLHYADFNMLFYTRSVRESRYVIHMRDE